MVDVRSDAVIARGLSMPHSPRLKDGKLWLLNSGRGELGWIDPARGRFNPIAFCPGFARGLALVGRYAVVGLSRPRRNKTFEGLPLQDALQARGASPRCGIVVIDIETGATEQWLRFERHIEELYDVAALPGVVQGEALGLKPQDLERTALPEMPQPP